MSTIFTSPKYSHDTIVDDGNKAVTDYFTLTFVYF
jgi:predicted SnoaL-like aldol condensation-catalyzing enzyme